MASPFRLARLLRLRSQLRQQAQDEVAALQAAESRAVAARAAVRAAVDATRDAELDGAAAGLTGAELAGFRTYERALRAREESLAVDVTHLSAALAEGRQALVGRRRQERQLELLEERAQDRARAEEARATTVLVDDLALRQRRGRR
jgi:flagellar export protein FliJ